MGGQYAQVKNAFCTLQEKGIMTALYAFMVRHEHVKLISDYHMSTAGEALWNSIISKRDLIVRVLDLDTGKKYSLEDAKKQNIKTNDGKETVILPKMDARDKSEQRFMYVAESMSPSVIDKLKDDDILPGWKGIKERLLESAELIPCYGYRYWDGP